MTWEISKEFNCCYGHRVYTQTTNSEYALNRPPKCRHRHGHEGLLKVFIQGDLKSDGMVTDFCNLGWLKKFIDDTIDHKFIFGIDDPLFKSKRKEYIHPVYVPDTNHVVGYTADLSKYSKNTPEYEDAEGHIMVDFIPTSENLCKWLFDLTDVKMKRIGVRVSKVEWNETPKSKATYQK